jgi:hypothetical protein
MMVASVARCERIVVRLSERNVLSKKSSYTSCPSLVTRQRPHSASKGKLFGYVGRRAAGYERTPWPPERNAASRCGTEARRPSRCCLRRVGTAGTPHMGKTRAPTPACRVPRSAVGGSCGRHRACTEWRHSPWECCPNSVTAPSPTAAAQRRPRLIPPPAPTGWVRYACQTSGTTGRSLNSASRCSSAGYESSGISNSVARKLAPSQRSTDRLDISRVSNFAIPANTQVPIYCCETASSVFTHHPGYP